MYKKQRRTSFSSERPLVSVVMPVYNAKDFLAPAIESILCQTYQNFEFIIVDDFSTDGSWEIIQKYQKKNIKIITIRMRKNLNRGGDTCANEGIKKAKGVYIARMDADDISFPNRLQRQVAFLEQNKDVWLVGSQAKVIDENGESIGLKRVPSDHETIYNDYFTIHPIIHPSVMFRNKKKGRPFYNIKYSANNDYYTFFRLITQGKKFANIQENLLQYRIHKKSDTFSNIKEKIFNTVKIRLEMIKRFDYKPTTRAMVIFIVQVLISFVMPEKIIVALYCYYRGIKKMACSRISFLGKRIFLVR